MTELVTKKSCFGCGACAAVCPLSCIAMEEDGEGFRYPKIDKERCIRCGKCQSVCPSLRHETAERHLKTYAARNLQEEIRLKSSSGGVFSLLAKKVIAADGVVFGAALNEALEVVHTSADSDAALEALQGSKYLQSRAELCYSQTAELLKKGKTVLFSGTPCQINGLKAFLGKEEERLICVDIVCHGVPSSRAWRSYVTELEKSTGAKLRSVSFRDKSEGWRSYRFTRLFENGEIQGEKSGHNPFMQGYLAHLYLRPSCHGCSKISGADLTLGDCWGAEFLAPDLDDNRGTSLIIVRTEKGAEMLDSLADELLKEEISYFDAVCYNPAICTPAEENKKRALFFARPDEPFTETVRVLAKPSFTQRWKARLRTWKHRFRAQRRKENVCK